MTTEDASRTMNTFLGITSNYSRAEIKEEIILLHIEKNRCEFTASTDDLIALHEAGLTEKVIRVIMDKASGSDKVLTHRIDLLTQQMRSPELERINDAIRKLVSLKPSSKVASMLTAGKYLESSSPQIRQGVCEALGKLGSPAAMPRLMDMLRDPMDMVRHKAAQAVANLHDSDTLEKLITLRGQEPLVRDGIYFAMGYIGDRAASEHLVKFMQQVDDQSGNRAAAAFSLGLLGDTNEKVLDALKRVILEDIFPEVRGNAITAYGRLRTGVSDKALRETILILRKAYDRYPMNRKDILEALGNFADGQAILLLIDGLRPENRREVRETAWRSLRQITQERFKEDHDEWDAWWNIKGKRRFPIIQDTAEDEKDSTKGATGPEGNADPVSDLIKTPN